MWQKIFLSIFLTLSLLSCTKEKQVVVYTNRYSNPNKVIVAFTVDLPPEIKKTIPKKTTIIWSIVDDKGQMVAQNMHEMTAWPHTTWVVAKDLKVPVQENTKMLLTIRVVKLGDEFKPPQKGELVAQYGDLWVDTAVATPVAKEAQGKEDKKSMSTLQLKSIKIGDQIKLTLKPSVISFG
jgi:hypothetical protein